MHVLVLTIVILLRAQYKCNHDHHQVVHLASRVYIIFKNKMYNLMMTNRWAETCRCSY